MDCSPPGSSVRGIFQAGILEWVTMPFSRESSQPRDWTFISYISCIAGGFFSTSATREALYIYTHIYIYIYTHIYTISAIYVVCIFWKGWCCTEAGLMRVCACVCSSFMQPLSCQRMAALVLYFMISSVQMQWKGRVVCLSEDAGKILTMFYYLW